MEPRIEVSPDSTDRVHDAWVDHHEQLWRSLLAWSGNVDIASEAVAEAFAHDVGGPSDPDGVGRSSARRLADVDPIACASGRRGAMDESMTYLLVDGENIDVTLGSQILRRKPHPDERPRWDRLVSFAEQRWNAPVTALFFLNATETLPLPFVQALDAMDYRVVPLSGSPEQKVVDLAIQRTLQVLTGRPASDVLLVSHDGDFIETLTPLVEDGRRVGLIVFDEFCNAAYRTIAGLEIFDLERDVDAFTSKLPRLRVIPIDEFDPNDFL